MSQGNGIPKKAYNNCFVNECDFAWLNSLGTQQTYYDMTDVSWLNWHFFTLTFKSLNELNTF